MLKAGGTRTEVSGMQSHMEVAVEPQAPWGKGAGESCGRAWRWGGLQSRLHRAEGPAGAAVMGGQWGARPSYSDVFLPHALLSTSAPTPAAYRKGVKASDLCANNSVVHTHRDCALLSSAQEGCGVHSFPR